MAPAALAQTVVEFVKTDPPVLHALEPFEVIVGGHWSPGDDPGVPRVSLDGDVIFIRMTGSIESSALTEKWGTRVRLAGLRDGDYTVVVLTADDDPSANSGDATIEVLPGSFSVTPSFGQAGSEVLIEGIPLNECVGPLVCGPLQVRFGNVPATEVRVTDERQIIAKVPPGSGVVDVKVRGFDGREQTRIEGFAYGPGLADPDRYERVLFPMVFAGAGAHGSVWRSENIVRNDSPVAIPTEPVFQHGVGTLAPGSRAAMREAAADAGAFLWMPRGAEKWLTYSSHIADRSRSASDRGSELPVVHAEDTSATIRLVDVPLLALYRARLRIYDFDPGQRRDISIVVRRENGTEQVIRRVLADELGPCVGPCFPHHPAMTSVDLSAIPELANAGKVDVFVRAATEDARIWAFVSVSNNETQHVTMYTPQHEGAEVVR
jgi:hypothetical protein